MAWVLFNEQRDSYWHPDLPRGVTLLHPERAYRWDTRAEAAEVCDGDVLRSL